MNELDPGRDPNAAAEREHAYRNELLFALRMRGVPGPRIAETLAEVSSHLSDTGEDPQEAFGPPKAYADDVAAALSDRDSPTPFRREVLSWRTAVFGVGGALGTWLVVDGALAFAADGGDDGLPAAVSLAAGVALLLALAVGLLRLARKRDVQVLDPRTGADLTPALPRWVVPVMVAVPVLALVLAVVLGLMSR